jgi:hypothetical protein
MDFIDFTLFDCFIKNNNELYLILSINNVPVIETDLDIYLENNNLRYKCKIEKNEYEPILIYIYEILEPIISYNLTVKYRQNPNMEFKFKLLPEYKLENKRMLSLTTLFKNDYYLFPCFYNYYKKQGVDHFYLYYNDIIDDNVKNLLNKEDVTLIEWNFRYWNPETFTYLHHAQLGQMHHALHKFGKSNYEYMIFCDFDEYMYINNRIKLVNYLNKKKYLDIIGFKNYWCK